MTNISIHNCDMDIQAIRKANFLYLLANECGPERGRNRVMAGKIDREPNYISQIKNEYVGIGDAMARRLEKGFCKEHGWMDVLQDQLPDSLEIREPGATYHTSAKDSDETVIILETDEITDFVNGYTPERPVDTVKSPVSNSEFLRVFAWRDQSNTNAPLLPAGTIYTILPTDRVSNGAMVAVMVSGNLAVGIYDRSAFGEAILTTGTKKHELPEEHHVFGVVISIVNRSNF